MKNPFDVLGIPRPTAPGPLSTAQLDEAKKAFRKLSMQHHPDRGGDEEKFKEIKLAWEQIESGKAPGLSKPVGNARMEDILREFKQNSQKWKANEGLSDAFEEFKMPPEVVAKVTYKEAYLGFSMQVKIGEKVGIVKIPGKLPDNHVANYKIADGTEVRVRLRIQDPKFLQRDPDGMFKTLSADTVTLSTGDLVLNQEVDALDILLGSWITVEDYLGEKFAVRVPQGFDITKNLKVAGKGYFDLDAVNRKTIEKRADLYLTIWPVFDKTANMSKEKVKQLYEQVCDPAQRA